MARSRAADKKYDNSIKGRIRSARSTRNWRSRKDSVKIEEILAKYPELEVLVSEQR